jgi:hypothetical protein
MTRPASTRGSSRTVSGSGAPNAVQQRSRLGRRPDRTQKTGLFESDTVQQGGLIEGHAKPGKTRQGLPLPPCLPALGLPLAQQKQGAPLKPSPQMLHQYLGHFLAAGGRRQGRTRIGARRCPGIRILHHLRLFKQGLGQGTGGRRQGDRVHLQQPGFAVRQGTTVEALYGAQQIRFRGNPHRQRIAHHARQLLQQRAFRRIGQGDVQTTLIQTQGQSAALHRSGRRQKLQHDRRHFRQAAGIAIGQVQVEGQKPGQGFRLEQGHFLQHRGDRSALRPHPFSRLSRLLRLQQTRFQQYRQEGR